MGAPQDGALVGLPWREAEGVLIQARVPFMTVVTAPPGCPEGTGELRVVGDRNTGTGRLVILAYQDYRRAAEGAQP